MCITFKQRILWLSLLLLTVMCFTGCQQPEPPVSSYSDPSAAAPPTEYGFCLDEQFYGVNQPDSITLTDCQREEFINESDYGSGRTYQRYMRDGLTMTTYLPLDADGAQETPLDIKLTGAGHTPRGIQIGDDLSTLKAAYPDELLPINTWSYASEEGGPRFHRVYVYAPEDGTVDYLAFFLQDSIIVMMEAADSDGVRPGDFPNFENLLGFERIIKEDDNYYPKDGWVRYYAEDNGEETLLFEFHIFYGELPDDELHPRYLEELDLDEDGLEELIVSSYSRSQESETEIYYRENDQIKSFSINRALGSYYSSLLSSNASVKGEYRNCFELHFEKPDGSSREEVYRWQNGSLEYLCSSEEIYLNW